LSVKHQKQVGKLDTEVAKAVAVLGLALAHPLRVQILLQLVEEPGSAKTLSDRLDVALNNVSYHLRDVLDRKCKVVAKVRQREVRGATETFYRVDADALVRLSFSLQNLPTCVQASFHSASLVAFFTAAIRAVEFAARGGELQQGFAQWRPGPVDEHAWQEIMSALAIADAQISRAAADSVNRLNGRNEIQAIFGVGAFALPPPGSCPADGSNTSRVQ
jgi:DNA-binding transcriptional ArsR family regulator